MLLVLLAVALEPIRWVACARRAIEERTQSAAMREAAWLNAVAACQCQYCPDGDDMI